MVIDNIDLVLGTFEVMPPDLEAFEYGKEFFVMHVVIALGFGEGMGMEGDGMDFAVRRDCGDDAGEGIVRGISFNKDGVVGGPMGEDRSFCKRLLE